MFIMLGRVALPFESVDEILKSDHSNESYWAVLSCGRIYYALQGVSNFWVCGQNSKVWPFKQKLPSSIISCGTISIIMLYITFESLDEILKCDH